MKKLELSKLLFIGNVIFGMWAIISWTLFVTIKIPIEIPLTMNIIQGVFLLLQYLDGLKY